MKQKFSMNILFYIFGFVFLSSCGAKDADKIAEAQACLDKATAATVESCASKVSGLTSAGAYGILCSAKFISERFEDPNKYIDALNSISGGTGSSNMMNLMGLLMFSTKGNITQDTTNMATTFDYCYKANTKGALLFSSFGYMGASLYSFANTNDPGSCSSTPSGLGTTYSLGSCLTSFTSNIANAPTLLHLADATTSDSSASQVQSAIGTIVITTYTVSCSTSQASKELCDYFNTSINSAGGTSNTRAVGVSFIKTLLGI